MKRSRKRSYIKRKPKEYKGSYGNNSPFYLTARWRKTSKAYRQRHPICEICLTVGMFNPSEETDHIKPIPMDATESQFWNLSYEDNFQAICKGHHQQKSAREGNENNKT